MRQYVGKPINRSSLVNMLQRYLKRSLLDRFSVRKRHHSKKFVLLLLLNIGLNRHVGDCLYLGYNRTITR